MSKNAIVTGAAGNMGKAVVQTLLKDGFNVLGTALEGDDCGNNEQHPSFEKYIADVTDENQCQQLVKYAREKIGEIQVAALLVGGFGMSKFEDTSLEDIHKMFKLNFESAFVSSKAVYKQVKKQSTPAKIILIGAKPALEKSASAGLTAYALSKSLIFKLAEHINAESGGDKITASVIVPSILDTPPNREAMPEAKYSDWVTPEDVARVVSFIASDGSKALRDPVFRVYGNA